MTAAATRKLQKEIDNVLKKVDDGISEFADCWDQATTSGSAPQKERLGEELKKSINKLQRFRVQIRDWLSQSAVPTDSKDKLEDARKRIESDMQRFKDFERELKTKAFSTFALAKGDELELEEQEKMKNQEWLASVIHSLNEQLEQFEADLEILDNKRSLSNDDKARKEVLVRLAEQHRWHIKKLEQLLRGVDNDAIDLGDVALVRESIDFYVENNEDENCYHDDSVYDSFDLTEYEEKAVVVQKSRLDSADSMKDMNSSSSNNGKDDAKSAKAKEKNKRKDEKKEKKLQDKKGAAATPTSPTSHKSAAGKVISVKSVDSFMSAEPSNGSQGEPRDPELDEIKVQEDQLLSEAAEFICKICQIHVAGCGPKLTSCSHLFCGDCIAQWFDKHAENKTWAQRATTAGKERYVPCPCCKQPLNEKKDLYPVSGQTSRCENLLLWRMLSSLKIVCMNNPKICKDGKCDWQGEYGNYQAHAIQCKNQPGQAAWIEASTPARTTSMDFGSDDGASTPGAPSPAAQSPAAPATPKQGAVAAGKKEAKAKQPAAQRAPAPAAASQPVAPVEASAPAPQPRQPPAVSKAASKPGEGPSISTAPATPTPAPAVQPSAQPAAQIVAEPAVLPAVQPAPQSSPQPAAQPAQAAVAASEATRQQAREEPKGRTVRAVAAFEASDGNTVNVRSGDLIEVLEQHSSGWTYGKNVTASSVCGWMPSWLVPKPAAEEPAEPEARPQARPAPAAHVETPAPTPTPAPAVEAASPVQEVRLQQTQVTAAFSATTDSQLSLSPQDVVEVVERHASGWTYGRKVRDGRGGVTSLEGWFPDWVVQK